MVDSAFSADPDALLRELGWVRALARTLVRDRDTAEDIAQDTLLAAWSTRTKPRGALRPWLARILRRRKVDRVDLRFTHPGYARTELSWCQAGEFVEVVLQPAGELEVTVVDDTTHPVADAEITFYRYDRTSRDGGAYDWRRQVTDAEGRTVFLDMAPVDRLNFGNLKVEHPYAGGSTYVWPAVVVRPGNAHRSSSISRRAARSGAASSTPRPASR